MNTKAEGYEQNSEGASPSEGMQLAARPQQMSLASQTAGAAALVQRTLGEVQIAVMMAKQFPRDKIASREKLTLDCMREGLAKVAQYSYAKGGTSIKGPSIRLAEAAKNAWGNMQSGWRELTRTTVNGVGVSEVESFAWDAENNTRASISFTVRHWRDTKQGGYPIKEEREIYELCANQAARRERACILKMIDGDMIEAAIKQCDETLTRTVNLTPELIASILAKFEEFDVTKAQIEKRIQRRMDAINAPIVLSLTNIYNSLKDGMSKPEEWFDAEEGAGTEDDEKKATGNEGVKEKLKNKGKQKPAVSSPNQTPHDPNTGEVQEQVAKQNQQAAASPALQEEPEIDRPLLTTPAEVKHAGDVLVSALDVLPEDQRTATFLRLHGPEICDALKESGFGVQLGKLSDLGISLSE